MTEIIDFLLTRRSVTARNLTEPGPSEEQLDMILTGGYNVSGLEVEAVLLEHPKVRECAVVGAPDARRGQIVKAFVVPADTAEPGDGTVAELQDFVKSQISAFKYPRAIEFVDDLPHTATGKIQRGALRQRERERSQTDDKG